MDMESIKIQLGNPLREAAINLAAQQDISLGQLIRTALSKEIARANNAKPPVRADEQLIAPLRARLANDLAYAENWSDLQNRLKHKGYVFRVAGGGLALHDWPKDRRICKASELGFSYSKLMRRFGMPFPNHPHQWLADRMLTQPEDAEDDIFEPFE